MTRRAKYARWQPRRLQRGQGMLILVLLIVGLLGSAVVYSLAGRAQLDLDGDAKTYAALAAAKEALIGYAAGHTSQPGILPCPDTDNDGSADSPCGASGVTAVGRLPWRTLGLADIRDGTGQCLWYAVSANFKNSGVSGPAIVNSDSVGTLAVNNTSGTAIYSGSNSALAIIFAPGSALSGQDRSPAGTAVCGGNTTVANYLEGGNQNGAATNVFVTGQATTSFNDNMLAITSDALFSVVTLRVAKEVRAALENYRARIQAPPYSLVASYPPANPYTVGSPYNCNSTTYHGRIPLSISGTCPPFPDWTELPSWFQSNNWNLVTHYAVSRTCTTDIDAAVDPGSWAQVLCDVVGGDLWGLTSTGSPLSVTGVNPTISYVRALVIVTGRALGAQVHPCGSAAACLEDAANADSNSVYYKPTRLPSTNDHLAIICGSAQSPCNTVP